MATTRVTGVIDGASTGSVAAAASIAPARAARAHDSPGSSRPIRPTAGSAASGIQVICGARVPQAARPATMASTAASIASGSRDGSVARYTGSGSWLRPLTPVADGRLAARSRVDGGSAGIADSAGSNGDAGGAGIAGCAGPAVGLVGTATGADVSVRGRGTRFRAAGSAGSTGSADS